MTDILKINLIELLFHLFHSKEEVSRKIYYLYDMSYDWYGIVLKRILKQLSK